MKQLLVMTVTGLLAAAGAAIAGLLLAGASTEQVQVIPWTDALVPATRYVPPVPKHARPCSHPRDIRIRYEGPAPVNSTETVYWVRVRNLSTKTCFLEGRPGIRLARNPGSPIAVREATGPPSFPPSGPPGFPEEGARFGLAPRASAYAYIDDEYFCQSKQDYRLRSVPISASLAGVSSTRLRITACRKSEATLAVSPWTPPDRPARRTSHWPLKIELQLPKSFAVRPDATIAYRVRLTNTGKRPFRFPPGACPDFELGISGSGIDGSTMDNCHLMRPLASGSSAVFILHDDLAFYSGPLVGMRTAVWRLHDGTKTGMTARGRIEFSGPTHA